MTTFAPHRQAVPQIGRSSVASFRYDAWLLGATLCLVAVGLIMAVSTSVSIAERREFDPLYYFWRQIVAVALGCAVAAVILKVPLKYWQSASALMLFGAVILLVAVLVPGLGRAVNGSMRWLFLGPVSLQASEPAKLAVIIYLAAYLVRHNAQVRRDFLGFIKPIGVLTVIAGLYLLEPDFGAAVVLLATGLGMLFLAGVPFLRFTFWGVVALSLLGALATLAPYRVQRLLAFMDPWSDPYNSGFQLTQALIAFGRGEWFGVGLGNSVQKLFYLPEVHTDFVFAVIGEEAGLFGTVAIISLFVFLLWRVFYIGGVAERVNHLFAAYLTYGIGLVLGIQAFVNMGVNMGLLPTKGLPLPFLSYASNNMIVNCAAIALVLRAGFEAQYSNPPDSVGNTGV